MIKDTSDLSAPLPSSATEPEPLTQEVIERYFGSNESGENGWYPVGAGQVWHPGVHLWSPSFSTSSINVRALGPGRIVAARLDVQPDGGGGHQLFGSPGFVLVEHKAQTPEMDMPVSFYALYMHLEWPEGSFAEYPWLNAFFREESILDAFSLDELKKWLGLDALLDFFGVEAVEDAEQPDDGPNTEIEERAAASRREPDPFVVELTEDVQVYRQAHSDLDGMAADDVLQAGTVVELVPTGTAHRVRTWEQATESASPEQTPDWLAGVGDGPHALTRLRSAASPLDRIEAWERLLNPDPIWQELRVHDTVLVNDELTPDGSGVTTVHAHIDMSDGHPFKHLPGGDRAFAVSLDALNIRARATSTANVLTTPSRNTHLQSLGVSAKDENGETWQAVRFRLAETEDERGNTTYEVVETGGAWAYGWAYDGAEYTSTRSLDPVPAVPHDVAQRLMNCEVVAFNDDTTWGRAPAFHVQAGDPLGQAGAVNAGELFGSDDGCHLEIFLGENPLDCGLLSAEDGWCLIEDETASDIFCTAEDFAVSVPSADASSDATGDGAPADSSAARSPASAEAIEETGAARLFDSDDAVDRLMRVFDDGDVAYDPALETLRRAVVRTTSSWAIDWHAVADKNPDWSDVFDLDETTAAAMQRYMWWDEAVAAGASLPEPDSAMLYHVHPVAWLQALNGALPDRHPGAYLRDPEITMRRDDEAEPSDSVRQLQRDLHALGFDLGSIDGVYGAATEAAVVCFQVESYYAVVDGRLDLEEALEAVQEAYPESDNAQIAKRNREALGKSRENWMLGEGKAHDGAWEIDGIVGPGAKSILRAWFALGFKAEFPREINVAGEAKAPQGSGAYYKNQPIGMIVLDRENCGGGVFHYQSGESTDQVWRDRIEWWGQPAIVYLLERVARKWVDDHDVSIQIGDMTRPQGGPYFQMKGEALDEDVDGQLRVTGAIVPSNNSGPDIDLGNGPLELDHSTHSFGRVADARPMVTTREHLGQRTVCGDIHRDPSPHYDKIATYELLKLINAEAPRTKGVSMIELIYWNDADFRRREEVEHEGETRSFYVEGVEPMTAHHHHFHIRVRDPLEIRRAISRRS